MEAVGGSCSRGPSMGSRAPHGRGCKGIPSPALGCLLDATATLQSSTYRPGVRGERVPVLALHPHSHSSLALLLQTGVCWRIPSLHSCPGNGNATPALAVFLLWEGWVGSTLGKAGTVTASTAAVQSVVGLALPTPSPASYLRLNV